MNEAFEKILERLEEPKFDISCGECPYMEKCDEVQETITNEKTDLCAETMRAIAKEIVQEVAEEYNGGWIPCSERLPDVETEVLISTIRKFKDGSVKNIITTAMYEDGTVRENDSCWYWEDVEGEWDEEEDCYIILEGWWEDKKYNADGELNHAVYDKVIAWQPLPEAYKESE